MVAGLYIYIYIYIYIYKDWNVIAATTETNLSWIMNNVLSIGPWRTLRVYVPLCVCVCVCVCVCSVAKSCLALCDPIDYNTTGFPVLHHLLEFAQTHVHWVDDAIQPSHPLLPLFLLPLVFPSTRVFSSESALCIRWPKDWSFNFSSSPSNEYSGLISIRVDWFDLLAVQGTLESLLQHLCYPKTNL